MTDFDWRNQAIYLAPGSLIVVGPMGWFKLSAPNEHGERGLNIENCDFLGAGNDMTPAHKAIVDERWAMRTETGGLINKLSHGHLHLDEGLAKKLFKKPKGDGPTRMRPHDEGGRVAMDEHLNMTVKALTEENEQLKAQLEELENEIGVLKGYL